MELGNIILIVIAVIVIITLAFHLGKLWEGGK